MRETEMKVLLCKTLKNPETDGYERDRRLYIEIIKTENKRNNDN